MLTKMDIALDIADGVSLDTTEFTVSINYIFYPFTVDDVLEDSDRMILGGLISTQYTELYHY